MRKKSTGDSVKSTITRRDFVHGAGVAIGAAAWPGITWGEHAPVGLAAATGPSEDAAYPPGLLALRGNHEGSQVYPHLARDGALGSQSLKRNDTGEHYDLVVVGAGISGLTAAYLYRKNIKADARILILDNHDDFGGHAKRNEFHVDGHTLLSYGGTQAIDSPSTYRPTATALLKELGVDVRGLPRRYDKAAYRGLGTACFFDRETFGADRVLTGMGTRPWPEFLKDAPLSERSKQDIARLYAEKRDYLPHLPKREKRKRLREMSYARFLVDHCGVDASTTQFFQSYPHDLYGVGIDSVSALTCYENPDDYDSFTYPGLDGLGLEPVSKEAYVYMFPDGNATVARLLVRQLIPSAIPAASPDLVVRTQARYERLDVPGESVRLRLRSAAVGVERRDSGGVAVEYVNGEAINRVTAGHCVLACYHGMIPYLCPSLPDDQKKAMHYGPKVPFLYTHVALRNWRPFAKLGVRQIVAPGAYHSYTALAFPVNSEGYRCSQNPDEPVVLFMMRAPCAPGLPRKEQHRAGRAELLGTPYAAIENHIRDQLTRMLGAAGFDSERDIAAITVNRWAHGYTYDYDSLTDPEWPSGQAPHEIARRPFGPIVIANADASAQAYTDAAIDMAYRAIGELSRQG